MALTNDRQIKEGALRPEKDPVGPPPVATVINPATGKPISPPAATNGGPPKQQSG